MSMENEEPSSSTSGASEIGSSSWGLPSSEFARPNEEAGSSSNPASSSQLPKVVVVQDEDYYMNPWFVLFEVEGHLFRVPSYQFLKESPDFAKIYDLHVPSDIKTDAPIKLKDVRVAHFRSLLKVLYPLSVSVKLSLSTVEWISVLTLASEWRFLRLREMAIFELERMQTLTFVEKICLGRESRVSSWVIEGFLEVINRPESITDDEAIDIDSGFVTTVYKLFRIRESRIVWRLSSTTVAIKVKEIFEEELDTIRSQENTFKALDPKAEQEIIDAETAKKEEEERRFEEERMLQEERSEEEARLQEAVRIKKERVLQKKRATEEARRVQEERASEDRRVQEERDLEDRRAKKKQDQERRLKLDQQLRMKKKVESVMNP